MQKTNEEPQYNVITTHYTEVNGQVLQFSVCYNYIPTSSELHKEPDMILDYTVPYKINSLTA